jgi:hypothetical protein
MQFFQLIVDHKIINVYWLKHKKFLILFAAFGERKEDSLPNFKPYPYLKIRNMFNADK